MFTGQDISVKYQDDKIRDRNMKIIKFFSTEISKVNKYHFKAKLVEKLDEEHRALIREIDNDDEPLVDHYGRVTYFYFMLGGNQLPVYQPGSIMFESAVRNDSELSVVAHGAP
jgi:hypothetical protein